MTEDAAIVPGLLRRAPRSRSHARVESLPPPEVLLQSGRGVGSVRRVGRTAGTVGILPGGRASALTAPLSIVAASSVSGSVGSAQSADAERRFSRYCDSLLNTQSEPFGFPPGASARRPPVEAAPLDGLLSSVYWDPEPGGVGASPSAGRLWVSALITWSGPRPVESHSL